MGSATTQGIIMPTTQQTIDDIVFLLSFAPALSADDVSDGLSSMFYMTGSYQGDLKIATRVEEIRERHCINTEVIESLEEDEINS